MSNLGGRPPLYATPEALQEKIDEYFKLEPQITITGLCLFLGFESRQSFYDYEKNEGFSYIIKKARMQVENAYEKRLAYDKPTGAIFALKNMGWNEAKDNDTPLSDFVKQLIIKAASDGGK